MKRHTAFRRVWILCAAMAGLLPSIDLARSQSADSPNAVMLFAGRAADTPFFDLLYAPWQADWEDIGIVAASYSRKLGTLNALMDAPTFGSLGDNLSFEAEAGLSARFGDEDLGEMWTAVYLRFSGFPWNDIVYTTIAGNIGLSVLSEKSQFEKERDGHKTEELLHYLGPEITVADPDMRDLELVFRLHHRSGVYGLFNGVDSGSTFLTGGLRVHF
jgi:hypothetical protein